jgi:rod shape determining protein RodA
MNYRNTNVWRSVDWLTIALYLILILCGWFSICGASYNFGDPDFFDLASRSGKQMVWMICSLGLAFILLMLDDKLYDMFSYFFYIGVILLLILTIFIAPDVKGSRSWLQFGPISLQPAEFAKFITALTLAKFMSSYSFSMHNWRNMLALICIILFPMCLIVLQKETGSALIYLAFFLVLYREGMSGYILFAGVCAVIYFVIGIRFSEVHLGDGITPIGEFAILTSILFTTTGMSWAYKRKFQSIKYIAIAASLLFIASYIVSTYIMPFNLTRMLYLLCGIVILYLLYLFVRERLLAYLYISLFALGSISFVYSMDYVFDHVLESHQQMRIKVVLGMEEDLTGAGYNVNQSKIAIGSGGMTGKGFLNGTQTKLKYVPEQDTDFIFCTVGEEQGFIGSTAVLLLFLALILRLIYLSERQSGAFGRIYGYSVVSIILLHVLVNIGMVVGLTPVIGIPLPFFSYGGSSLWGFTLLLFIFLRIDAGRDKRF